jgi:hypothetical protein
MKSMCGLGHLGRCRFQHLESNNDFVLTG